MPTIDEQINRFKKISKPKEEMIITLPPIVTVDDFFREKLPYYKPLDKAVNFHHAPQNHRGLKGGVGSGKTYTLCADDIMISYFNRPLFHLCTSPSYDNALVTVVPVLEELCTNNNLKYDWEVSKNLFRIFHAPTPSSLRDTPPQAGGDSNKDTANILIFGADQPKFLKGITAASGSMNEPFTQKKSAFMIWWERIRHPQSKRLSRAWGGTAEPQTMQWGHKYFDKESEETEDIYLDTITTYENKHLNPEYIAGLEQKYDEQMRKVYMLGESLNLMSTRAYYAFDRDEHVIDYDEFFKYIKGYDRRLRIILSFDFNVSPMCATEIVLLPKEYRPHFCPDIEPLEERVKRDEQIDDLGTYVQVAEYSLPNSNTGALCEIAIPRLVERWEKFYGTVIVTGDASAKHSDTRSDYNDVKIIYNKLDEFCKKKYPIRYEVNFPQKNPYVQDRVSFVNNLIEKRRYFICNTCQSTIKDRENVFWKAGSDRFILDKSDRSLTHLSDAGDYALWNTKTYEENYLPAPRGRMSFSDKGERNHWWW